MASGGGFEAWCRQRPCGSLADGASHRFGLGLPSVAQGSETCPGADEPPTPVEVSVTTVPIVVASTTNDTFMNEIPLGEEKVFGKKSAPEEEGFDEPVYLCGLRQNSQDRSNVAFQNMGAPGEGAITIRTTAGLRESAAATEPTCPRGSSGSSG